MSENKKVEETKATAAAAAVAATNLFEDEFEQVWTNGQKSKGMLTVDDKIAIAIKKANSPATTKNKDILISVLGDRIKDAPEYYTEYPGTPMHQVKKFVAAEFKRAKEIKAAGGNPLADEIINKLHKGGLFRRKAK